MLLTKDYEGLIIALRLKGIAEEKADENHVLVTARQVKTGIILFSTVFLKIMADWKTFH